MTPPPRLLAPGRHRRRAVPTPSASPHPASSTASSSRGPGRAVPDPAIPHTGLPHPDDPIPAASHRRRAGDDRGRGDIKEEDGNPPSATLALQSPFTVEPRIVTFPRRCHHIEAPRAWSSVTSSPPPHHHRSVHSFPEAGRNGRSLAKAPSRSGPLPQQQGVHGPLHCSVRGSGLFCQRGHCLNHHRRHVVMGDDLDVRTSKPSLDIFLAEMRRFEVLPSVKKCWNVTLLLLLAPVYCRRAAAS
uniref:Uncharacterized protein n=1 Tax=Oryza glumipatula TaxID=40148 RepID=A0A0D9YSW8_9ORYZ